jgi:PAS domain-containing protein
VILPFVIWAAVRFGLRATSLVVAISGLTAILGGLSLDLGVRSALVLPLQVFIGALSAIVLVLSSAMTQQWDVESGLRESEERYRTLFETSPDAIALLD